MRAYHQGTVTLTAIPGSYFWSNFALDERANTLIVCATPRGGTGYSLVIGAIDLTSGAGSVLVPAGTTGFDTCMGMSVLGNPPPAVIPVVAEIAPTSGPQKAAPGATVFVSGSQFQQTATLACRWGRAVTTAAIFHMGSVVECVLPSSPVAGRAWLQITNDGVTFSTDPIYYTFE